MSNVNDIIFECLEIALSTVERRDEFLAVLEQKYQLNLHNVGNNFNLFHEVLKEFFGLQHYAIERALIKTLHTRAIEGYYRPVEEMGAFSLMVNVFIADTTAEVQRKNRALEKSGFDSSSKD